MTLRSILFCVWESSEVTRLVGRSELIWERVGRGEVEGGGEEVGSRIVGVTADGTGDGEASGVVEFASKLTLL